ncbi:MAG: SUMF1/EgtB/PvdO family nonheme iron enzyme [bacterium]|nr:SUMF1/EgtB/PvdO family nonheme iron enzyme [bacterium]
MENGQKGEISMTQATQQDIHTLQAEITKLRQTLASLAEMAAEGLPVAEAQSQAQDRLSGLEARVAVLGDVVTGDKSTTFDQSEQNVDEQINVAGDYHDHRQIVAQPDAPAAALDDDAAQARYLDYVIETNRRLRLQGIRSASGLVSVELEEVYVTLTATMRRAVVAQESWEMVGTAPDDARHWEMDRSRETVEQVKVEVQEALAAYPRMVVLGDPGCGKTTLLRYLALTFARDLTDRAGLVVERLQLDGEQRLPVLLPLRDFGRYLETHHSDPSTDGPKLLLDYLRAYFANQDIPLPERFFADRLQRGECAVLLDGVDEVADFATRQRIARLVERFTVAYPENRYVVTSRIVGYTGAARLGQGYEVTRVRDFTLADVERFAASWNRAVEIALAGKETPYVLRDAQRQTETLLQAIRTHERVRELAVNPLLLTVIALVQRYRAQLPERRTELYEEAIEVLLVQWDAVKGLSATAVLQGLELDAGDRRGLLEPVALWMMEQRLQEIEVDDLRRQLGPPFHALTQDERKARKAVDGFLHLINERSGLLTERGQGIYAFSHLTFQEHLAARAVADRADNVAYTLERLGDSAWREVILLEVGYLSTQGRRRVTELIRAISDCPTEPELYYNLTLAAEALRDVGPARVLGDLGSQIQRQLRGVFAEPLRRGPNLADTVRVRAAAAQALARIESGGSGTQPAFWRLPHGEPVWVDVPAGEFWMGGEKYSDEEPVHRVHLERFQIARVPVTNAQYLFFVEATGHKPPSHWEDGRLPRDLESHPVVYVTWHDAMAYCRWLSEVMSKSIALPSEAQWEKAARGDKDRREYPWRDEWDETKCNTSELGLGSTSPVGIFPDGVSLYGCLDTAGNAWEWTRSLLWTGSGPDFRYPYDQSDGRENLDAGDNVRRVVRGGAFDGDRVFARCAFRLPRDPFAVWYDVGFRVVVSSISFTSGP